MFYKKYLLELIIFFSALCFSGWLFFHTFSYQSGNMQIAGKAWSDFASHIPLIRSFSFGWNVPPQYPLFPGEPIHYHFLFYSFVGLLERVGLPLDYALNIPSILGLTLLLCMVYVFAFSLFKSKATGVISIFLFLFNGSLGFLYFFKSHPLSLLLPQQIFLNTAFPSFAPYGEGLVTAFWNLNIYTNQRHFAAALGLSLVIVYLFLSPVLKNQKSQSISKVIFLGILLGASYYFHIAAFMMTGVIILVSSILFSRVRIAGVIVLLLAGIIAYPQYEYMNSSVQAFTTQLKPGYLVAQQFTMLEFSKQWAANLGLHTITMLLGFVFATGKAKKIFLSFFVLFLIGNLFQFSTEMAANHKFFNYFMLVGVMFSSYALVVLWKKSVFLKPLVVVLFFLLTLSGIIDFFPVLNDGKIILSDYPNNPDIRWIMKNTPPDAVFLNTSFLYSPESLAGRKMYLGWPYFAWSQGYDTLSRHNAIKQILSVNDKKSVCSFLSKNNISFISLTETSEDFSYTKGWWVENFKPSYVSKHSNLTIYAKRSNC